ncbi:hypothetical protein RFI_20184 [Reticulomyxa filosa]|uniref:Uncharacterized protein n=1 Tax=Reticulomyxa filosa TaxID=46433 RepID=X6MTZ1_RETFI|nr:hypothetical protein RFI_20184 [Reticulomyxa filosa]|eukprot:ETO17146.1 hypothetical protein RFI_20184 [Reticulomyxa filosa]
MKKKECYSIIKFSFETLEMLKMHTQIVSHRKGDNFFSSTKSIRSRGTVGQDFPTSILESWILVQPDDERKLTKKEKKKKEKGSDTRKVEKIEIRIHGNRENHYIENIRCETGSTWWRSCAKLREETCRQEDKYKEGNDDDEDKEREHQNHIALDLLKKKTKKKPVCQIYWSVVMYLAIHAREWRLVFPDMHYIHIERANQR